MTEKILLLWSKTNTKENWSSITKIDKEKYLFNFKNDRNLWSIFASMYW